MFGLGIDGRKEVEVVPPTRLVLAPGQLIFITGASGGGKSTLLHCIDQQLRGRTNVSVISFDELEPAGQARDAALVDLLGGSLEDAVRWLAMSGLNDAFVMLRKSDELSDGQRYRFRLALALEEAERNKPAESGAGGLIVVLADEFASTLDRVTAGIVARQVRKWVRRSTGDRDDSTGQSTGVCFIAATAHDDLLEALEPDVLVVQEPGAGIEVLKRKAVGAVDGSS
jgi:ABC-type ATPase with predicted acetyltransferase domain